MNCQLCRLVILSLGHPVVKWLGYDLFFALAFCRSHTQTHTCIPVKKPARYRATANAISAIMQSF